MEDDDRSIIFSENNEESSNSVIVTPILSGDYCITSAHWEDDGGTISYPPGFDDWLRPYGKGFYGKRAKLRSKKEGVVYIWFGYQWTVTIGGRPRKMYRVYRESDEQEFDMPAERLEPVEEIKE